jgi:hypothetical protein
VLYKKKNVKKKKKIKRKKNRRGKKIGERVEKK